MSREIDEHRQYLSDRPRLEAFMRALQATVRPGDVVLDLGAGTGILGLLACRAGAARVYAVDEGPIIELARSIAAASPFADRVTHVRGLSTWVALPERVDVIVTDQIGNFGIEAGAFEYVPDAARRLLEPGGRTVPCEISLWVAPVEHAEARAWVDFWKRPVMGLDFSAVCPGAEATGYGVVGSADNLLATGARVITARLAGYDGTPLEGRALMEIRQRGTVHGLLGWFSAELAEGVVMTNAPGVPDRINRRQVYFPVEPVPVAAGDRVTCRLKILPRNSIVDWTVTVRDRRGRVRGESRRSTFAGLLVSAEDLRVTASLARPRLSRAGEARRDVLELCDGTHTVDEIEAAIERRFPDLAPSREAAAGFVAEVLAVYGRVGPA
jgi:protein arginine N-methyltransferase 1